MTNTCMVPILFLFQIVSQIIATCNHWKSYTKVTRDLWNFIVNQFSYTFCVCGPQTWTEVSCFAKRLEGESLGWFQRQEECSESNMQWFQSESTAETSNKKSEMADTGHTFVVSRVCFLAPKSNRWVARRVRRGKNVSQTLHGTKFKGQMTEYNWNVHFY